MNLQPSDSAAKLIEGRRARVAHLFAVVERLPGHTEDFYFGKFTLAYTVKERTFYSYLATLKAQGRVIEHTEEGGPTYWTQEAWAMKVEEEKEEEGRREEERVARMQGKLEEFITTRD